MEEETFEKESMTSDFNEAKFQIMRLGDLWNRFNSAMLSGSYLNSEGANWILDNIWGELIRDAERLDKDKKGYEFKMHKINDMIFKNKNHKVKVYFILRRKQKILKRLQDEAGKGGRYGYSDDDMM